MAIDRALEDRIRSACEAGSWRDAATAALVAYGPELTGYLAALTRSAADADELFAQVAESLWGSLPEFRWDSSLRTYAYALARHAWLRSARQRVRVAAKREPLSHPEVAAVVAQVRSATASYLRTENKKKIARLREALDPDDRALLVLRVNREMGWRDIAVALSDPDDPTDRVSLDRRAASLRKRFERLKAELRVLLKRDEP